jgi:hypothetical protein
MGVNCWLLFGEKTCSKLEQKLAEKIRIFLSNGFTLTMIPGTDCDYSIVE